MENIANCTSDDFNCKSIDHLGLVSDQINELGIISLIDEKLQLSKHSGVKVTMGERVTAMILNGLGFVDSRLYIFPEFLEKKPVQRLFGKDLEPGWFNDDALGRCLDAISDYGVTKLFTEISFDIGKKANLLGRSVHFDTTTLQLFGEYSGDVDESSEEIPLPARGHSKSGRHDLKQMVLNLATTGKSSFPIWMESHSGNASDKKLMPKAAAKMNALCQSMKEAPDFIYVGDSALYSNILPHSDNMKWLTRVPENISLAKNLISKEITDWQPLSDGYKYYTENYNYKDVEQRWVLIYSEQSYNKEIKTLEKNIKKEHDEITKKAWHLGNKNFASEELALKSAKELSRSTKYHVIETSISEIRKYTSKGKPPKGAEQKVVGCKIDCIITENTDKISQIKISKGRFILSTNELDKIRLPDNEILSEYKKQSGTERGFKFIKNKSFEIDSIFLKTPSRISALMMIMTLCLMVYGISQHKLREALKKHNETIPDQRRKPSQKPSMEWVYFLFTGVQEVTVSSGNEIKRFVSNINSILRRIIGYFGTMAQSIYLNPT